MGSARHAWFTWLWLELLFACIPGSVYLELWYLAALVGAEATGEKNIFHRM